MLTDTAKSKFKKVSPLPFSATQWTDGFWKEICDVNGSRTIPHLQAKFESVEISHVVENFRICAGEAQGEFGGTNFGDGDFYKWMEAAMYYAAKTNDKKMFEQLDSYVDLISRAQLCDGYISTKQILGERQNNGILRLGDINDFEVYNFGHLFTAASLYFRLTGKDKFLTVAKKAAGYLEQMYEDNMKKGEVKTAVCPSHYMGLIELYRTTGDEKYLTLARLSIEARDSVANGLDDNQDRLPLKKHRRIIGHAVRANYLYAGVADLYLEEGDSEYLEVLHSVWRNLVDQKIYLTGGCGALYNGASPYGNFFHHQLVHQAYGYEYQLPNITAYNETCASVGSVLWAYRMFQIEPKAEYFDLIERTMLNLLPAAISLDGNKYFYENMLRRAKELPYELIWSLTREEYIISYCCPPNLARTLAEASEYAYLTSGNTVWTGMYGANRSVIQPEGGKPFTLVQSTSYPYDGTITFTIEDAGDMDNNTAPTAFDLNLRIPKWAVSGSITDGRKNVIITAEMAESYYLWENLTAADTLVLTLDMPVRYTIAHSLSEENSVQAAVERGPLVYCMETDDCEIASLDDILLDLHASFEMDSLFILERTIPVLKGNAFAISRKNYDRNALYQTLQFTELTAVQIRLIPYFAWDNRGYGEMRIWLPVAYR